MALEVLVILLPKGLGRHHTKAQAMAKTATLALVLCCLGLSAVAQQEGDTSPTVKETAANIRFLFNNLETMPRGGMFLSTTLRNNNPFAVYAVTVMCAPAGAPDFLLNHVIPAIGAGAIVKVRMGYIPPELPTIRANCEVIGALH
jgi:hypothetical protein